MFPNKFVPKIPVKKEKDLSESSSSTSAKPPISENSQPKKDQSRKKDQNRERDRDRGGRIGGRNGNDQREKSGGRGHWVMPTGVAFFTGNAPAQLATSVKNFILPVKQESGRVSRPNESIETVETTNAMTKKSTNEGEFWTNVPESDDSDATVNDEDDEPFDANGLEKWPPTRYDPYAPLSLPFGPRTAMTRKILASESILADPNDPESLLQEEQSSLFVMQMPSDLKFDKLLVDNSAASSSSSSANATVEATSNKSILDAQGKLGKIRLHRSGRVSLVTNDGNVYEIKAGLASSFLQCLSAIRTPTEADPNAIAASGMASAATAASSSTKKGGKKVAQNSSLQAPDGPIAVGMDGTVHFLGNITKKLVVTPTYELGVKKSKLPNQHNTAQKKQNTMEDEEIVMMEE